MALAPGYAPSPGPRLHIGPWTPAGTASANAAKRKIEADSGALKLLKADLLSNNAQVLQYLWSQTLRDDTHSKLLVGLDSNPAIVST